MLGFLKKVAKVATVATKVVPAVQAASVALEMIDEISSADKTKRNAMYKEMGADFCEIAASIMRATKDNEISDDEHAEIMRQIRQIAQPGI